MPVLLLLQLSSVPLLFASLAVRPHLLSQEKLIYIFNILKNIKVKVTVPNQEIN